MWKGQFHPSTYHQCHLSCRLHHSHELPMSAAIFHPRAPPPFLWVTLLMSGVKKSRPQRLAISWIAVFVLRSSGLCGGLITLPSARPELSRGNKAFIHTTRLHVEILLDTFSDHLRFLTFFDKIIFMFLIRLPAQGRLVGGRWRRHTEQVFEPQTVKTRGNAAVSVVHVLPWLLLCVRQTLMKTFPPVCLSTVINAPHDLQHDFQYSALQQITSISCFLPEPLKVCMTLL